MSRKVVDQYAYCGFLPMLPSEIFFRRVLIDSAARVYAHCKLYLQYGTGTGEVTISMIRYEERKIHGLKCGLDYGSMGGIGVEIYLKNGLSHEIFTVLFWIEWIYLGLNGNRFWFVNFKEDLLILDSQL
jgi:hypothetical protein